MIDEMYFISKGTVIFCLDKKYGEKEVKEFKKNNNFGEIEMCLNEKLSVNIKIKSRNCELFVLKKNDFLRLSVNFKEFIESFLHSSLMKYLKFNEEKNKMIKEFEDLIKRSDDYSTNEENESNEEEEENSDLIDSDNEENENESEKSDNQSKNEDNISKNNKSNKEQSISKKETKSRNGELKSDNENKSEKSDISSLYEDKDNNSKKNDSIKFERYNTNIILEESLKDENSVMSSLRMNKTLKNRQFSPISKKSSLKIPSKRTFSENTLFSLKECPKENSTENRNKVMANKLEKKIDKIIDSISEKDKFTFNHHNHHHYHNLHEDIDPRDLLNQLKKEDDPNKKNQLIDKIEDIFEKIYRK